MTNKSYKVLTLTHLKGQEYEVSIQTPSHQVILLPVHEELVLKFRLVIGKELDEEQIIELNQKLDLGRAYQYALNLLSKKSYTTVQIYEKLEVKAYEAGIIQEVLKRLVNVGLLNDEQYVQSYIQQQMVMGKKGPHKIKQELHQKGISDRLIAQYLSIYEEEAQLEHATKLANQVLRTNKRYGPYLIKQKVSQHLTAKGFSRSVIDQALSNLSIEKDERDNPILIKEIQKLIRRHRALSEYDKKIKVIQSLVRKGFSYDDILPLYERMCIELDEE
ncbi:MAG: RecX family transcriptional regulator [Turicibacter sp.]|nr:RecX family transcriptional regulator [Turicibacter sp.]